MGMSICTINHGQEYLTDARVKLFSIIKLKKLLLKDCVPLNNLVMIVQIVIIFLWRSLIF